MRCSDKVGNDAYYHAGAIRRVQTITSDFLMADPITIAKCNNGAANFQIILMLLFMQIIIRS